MNKGDMNLDDLVRDALAAHERDLAPSGREGDALDSVTASVRRRRDTRTALLAGLAVLVVALALPLTLINVGTEAAPTAPGPAVSPSATWRPSNHVPQRSSAAVPWIFAPATEPSPPDTSPLPASRRCTAADLPATALVSPEPAEISQENGIVLQVRNVGKSRCTLDGVPGVYYRTNGHTTARTSTPDPITAGGWVPATVDPGQSALVRVTRTFACNNPAPGIGNSVTANGITWAGREISFPTHSFAGACPDFMVSAWYTEPLQATFPAYSWDVLTATVDAPSAHTVGTMLYFTVTLTNATDAVVRLSPCPVYTIHVLESAQSYTLNCAAEPSIPAHTSVAFAMQADLSNVTGLPVASDDATPPHSLAPGAHLYKFTWSLEATPPDVLIVAAGSLIG